jgi:hypothetical protein
VDGSSRHPLLITLWCPQLITLSMSPTDSSVVSSPILSGGTLLTLWFPLLISLWYYPLISMWCPHWLLCVVTYWLLCGVLSSIPLWCPHCLLCDVPYWLLYGVFSYSSVPSPLITLWYPSLISLRCSPLITPWISNQLEPNLTSEFSIPDHGISYHGCLASPNAECDVWYSPDLLSGQGMRRNLVPICISR